MRILVVVALALRAVWGIKYLHYRNHYWSLVVPDWTLLETFNKQVARR